MTEGLLNALEVGRGVATRGDESPKRPWRLQARSAAVLLIALALATLGVANIASRAREQGVEDGVLWGLRPEGLTALAVGPGTGAARAGVESGDVLVAVNGVPVTGLSDLAPFEHRPAGTHLSYTLVRL